MGGIGPHVQRPTTAALDWAARAPIVKAIGDTTALRAAPDDATRIFRWVFAGGVDLSRPAAAARTILDGLGGYRHPRLYVETCNEPGKSDRVALLPFVRDVVMILHANGLLVAGPSWATGDYEAEDWSEFRASGWFGLDAIALHARWSHELGPTTWNGLRWRRFYDSALDRDLPVFVTECGIDRVRDGLPSIDGGMIGTNGWKLAGISADQYAGELARYARSLGLREFAMPFTSGADPDWDAYDVDEVSGLMGAATASAPPLIPPRAGGRDRGGTVVPGVTFGSGLGRAEGLIGPFAESSTFDDAGTDREVERIGTSRGWATWTRATNEVLVYVTDGSIWRDYGNHGSGQMERVSDPFLVLSPLPVVESTSPNHGGPRSQTRGVVVHSTRGGQVAGVEFDATLRWFADPASQVSAHVVIASTGQVADIVDVALEAWHAREYNAEWLGLELEQGSIGGGISLAQYVAAARWIGHMALRFGFPVNAETIVEHRAIPPGIREGKTDVGPPFSIERLLGFVTGR